MMDLYPLILAFPLIGLLINAVLGRRLGVRGSGAVASVAVLLSFVGAIQAFIKVRHLVALGDGEARLVVRLWEWIHVGGFSADLSLLFDPLSVVMILVVTGVGFLIHVYSIGYMSHDRDYARFFVYLNLFMLAMLLLVLGDNYLVLFVGWEGVGLCSYLLIGFWYDRMFTTKMSNAAAGKKAFIVNRVGDFGFLLALFLIFTNFHSLNFDTVFAAAAHHPAATGVMTAIGLLLLLGATGKSAQLPLFVWLPDAMAGPTPVSALIHAATMVTAGVYMVARSHILYALTPDVLTVVAWVGGLTAIFAATIACTQNDIKKVLAYSTVSQLGYMFLGLGCAAFGGGVFHVVTHAFFKALLFLGAGSVIHAMSDEQDIRRMGGLRHKLPLTFATFLIATLAIAGLPGFSGFFSKDEILAAAFSRQPALWGLGVVTAGLTSFYMFRLMFLTFFGKSRVEPERAAKLKESPPVMTVPLLILALLSIVGGLIGLPPVLGRHLLGGFLAPVFEGLHHIEGFGHAEHLSASKEWLLMGISTVAALGGFLLAWTRVHKVGDKEGLFAKSRNGFYRLLEDKYRVDEVYDLLIVRPLSKLARFCWRVVDELVIDLAVNFSGLGVRLGGELMRLFQNGRIQSYAFFMVLGLVMLLIRVLVQQG
ncbi:MAG: NADH-quinone oxidoreductase subunit L [bacterium]|nr:NADH-quinone oxidoreductase subunit L [bacterium]